MKKSYLKCVGCNSEYNITDSKPVYGCKNRGNDDINHILEKFLADELSLPKLDGIIRRKNNNTNPYSVFREFFFVYYLAEYLHVDYEAILADINSGLKKLGEPNFQETPILIIEDSKLSKSKLFIKNETVNVTGSHKARHLMGNILYLEVLVKAGILKNIPKLAVYSCGNAALGAAAVAKAAGYYLDVFIPPNISSKVTDTLKKYKANIVVCPRLEGEIGDPCYNRFQEALSSGSVPFSCAGPDSWSNIEGGQTLCLELMTQLIEKGLVFDSIVIQVGGGALASSAVKTLEELYKFGYIEKLPKIYTAQTEGGFPLVRAYCLLIKEIARVNNFTCSLNFTKKDDNSDTIKENQKIAAYCRTKQAEILKIVQFIRKNYFSDKVQTILDSAVNNMSIYMWNWEEEPHSIAHGILDDITYDWFKIIQGMFRTGGLPVIVDEENLKEANRKGLNCTDIKADHTGTSGLAGYLELVKLNYLDCKDNTCIFFTGAIR
jgi:threonine synthase